MKHVVKLGATSRVEYVFIQDSSVATGAGKTGLAYNTSSLIAYYARKGAAATAITLATQTATGAYSSGGFVEVDATHMPGLYRIDIPDAAFASGVDKVVVMISGAANMAPVALEYQLVAFDPDDAAALGLTRIDAAVTSRMATFTLPTNFSSLVIDSTGRVNAFLIGILTSVFTEGATGRIAAAFKQFFNIASPAATMDHLVLVDTATTATTASALTTNNDKTGYALTSAYDPAKTAAQAGDAMALTSGERGTLVSAIWDKATSALTTAGSIGKWILDKLDVVLSTRLASSGYTVPPTVGAIADQVWEETLTDHSGTSGSTAASLNAAGAAGDPWSTALPGSYGAGTAGKLLSDTKTDTASNVTSLSTLLSRLSAARAGYLDNLSAGAVALEASLQGLITTIGAAAAGVATAVWGAATRTLSAFGFHVQLATSQDQYAPSKAGDAMTLTSAYDAAKTAAQASDIPSAAAVASATAGQVTTDHGAGSYIRNTEPPTAAQNASAVRTELTTELGRIDAATSSRLPTSSYSAPDNAGIAVAASAAASAATSASAINTKIGTPAVSVSADIAAVAALVNALNDLDAATVKAQLVAALTTDTHSELTSVPAANAPLGDKLAWVFIRARNKQTLSKADGSKTVYADDGTTPIGAAADSDDDTVYTSGAVA